MAKYHCKVILHKRKPNARGAFPLRMRVTMRGEVPIDIPLYYSVREDEFSVIRQRVSASCPDAPAINVLISKWLAAAEDIFAHFAVLEKRDPTRNELAAELYEELGVKGRNGKPKTPQYDFFAVFNEFINTESKRQNWSDGTINMLRFFSKSIRTYDPHISFDAIDDQYLEQYLAYITDEMRYKVDTIKLRITCLKWLLRYAARKGYYHGRSHETFSIKAHAHTTRCKEVIYLTADELRRVETFDLGKNKKLSAARDCFVFCCYTGLRYSDLARLSRSDIKDGSYIEIVTQKTSASIRIELNTHARAILDRYKDADIPHGRALPVVLNAYMNSHIRVIGKLCGIDAPTRIVYFRGRERHEEVHPKYELLTSHVGRKTFVVQALRLGIPAEVIMKWTGHSSFEAMKPYIAIVDELKAQEMRKFDFL